MLSSATKLHIEKFQISAEYPLGDLKYKVSLLYLSYILKKSICNSKS